MKAIISGRKIEILDSKFSVEGKQKCEVSIEGNILKVVLPAGKKQRKGLSKEVIDYLENPDSECDIKTMVSASEVDVD